MADSRYPPVFAHLGKPGGEAIYNERRSIQMLMIVSFHFNQVVPYLTGEFYSENYNLRQRMDMLEVCQFLYTN